MLKPYQFSDFAHTIQAHPTQSLCDNDLLKIGQSGHLTSYYAPFDAINFTAKVVFVGICPGKSQWQQALNRAKVAQDTGLEILELLQTVKFDSAFYGPMRRNIVQMLDYVELNKKLGICSTQSLFEQHQHLVHMTSVLRHCILNKGQNYNGSTPNILKNDFLQQHIQTFFIPEIQQLSSSAVYIPMGLSVAKVLNNLVSLGYLNESQILDGFPHPSGANAERIQYFLAQKSVPQLSSKTNPCLIDQAKQNLMIKLKAINFDCRV